MSSMVLDGAMPRSRKSDPVTSVDAGRAANLSESQAVAYGLLTTGDFTQGEMERLIVEWSPSRIRSAVSELESCGLVEWTGETRRTRYGRQARVYRAVPSG